MKFRFYIISDLEVQGTNDEGLAMIFSHRDSYVVIDTKTAAVLFEDMADKVEEMK